jgi:hypothetical protein
MCRSANPEDQINTDHQKIFGAIIVVLFVVAIIVATILVKG